MHVDTNHTMAAMCADPAGDYTPCYNTWGDDTKHAIQPKILMDGDEFHPERSPSGASSQDVVFHSCISHCGEFVRFTMHVPKVCGGFVVGVNSNLACVPEFEQKGGDSRSRWALALPWALECQPSGHGVQLHVLRNGSRQNTFRRHGWPVVLEMTLGVSVESHFEIYIDQMLYWSCPVAVFPSSLPLFVHMRVLAQRRAPSLLVAKAKVTGSTS